MPTSDIWLIPTVVPSAGQTPAAAALGMVVLRIHYPRSLDHSAAKLLHQWHAGVLAMFVIVFLLLMVFALRGKLGKSIWAIPLSAGISYPAASLAYIVYFISFEPQRFVNTFNQITLETGAFAFGRELNIVALILFIVPTVTLSWLFGAIAGVVFFFFVILIRKSGHKS